MVTIHGTTKLIERLGLELQRDEVASTGVLGDWTADHVSTVRGDLIVVVNDRTLLTIVIPWSDREAWEVLFRARTASLLSALGVDHDRIERAYPHLAPVRIGAAHNRRVLGALDEIARHVHAVAEDTDEGMPIGLSELEVALGESPRTLLDGATPAQVAGELLATDLPVS